MIRRFCYLVFFFLSLSAKSQERTMGLIVNTEEAFNGYTLFSNNEITYLIDNCGYQVNSWESEYKSGYGLYLLPEGKILRAGVLPSNTFNAGGRGGIFELFNWEGERLWHFELANDQQHAHHDIAILPDGNFLCTAWELISEDKARSAGRKYPGTLWIEKILEIKILPDDQAEIVWEWSAWDHLIQDHDPNKDNYGIVAEHPELLDINFQGQLPVEANWLHLNSIAYHSELDQIVVSSRNMSEFYVIDHSTSKEEASGSSGGKYGRGGDILYRYGNPEVYRKGNAADRMLNRQHHVDWINIGTTSVSAFSVFNNEYIEGRQSSIQISANPADEFGFYHYSESEGYGEDTIIFLYTSEVLYSDILSGVQILANDNVLILEGRSGHAMEFNPNGDVVWEYINPVNRNGGPGIQGGTPQFNQLFRMIRYPVSYAAFSNRNLTPGDPVESSSVHYDCEIYNASSEDHEPSTKESFGLKILGNPIDDFLMFYSEKNAGQKVILYNQEGIQITTFKREQGINTISMEAYAPGIYYLKDGAHVFKLIKI